MTNKHDSDSLIELGDQVVAYTDVISNEKGLCMDCSKIIAITKLIESYAVWNEVENVDDITRQVLDMLGFSKMQDAKKLH